MAEVTLSRNRRRTRVDMTPVVDLGFLLLTFFILTTTLQKPVVMELGMPEKDALIPTQPVKCSETLTVFLDKNGISYQSCAEFLSQSPPLKTDFSARGLRRVLTEQKRRTGERFTVLLKATDQSSYGSFVDALDELAIADCQRYALVELTKKDQQLLNLVNR